MQVVVSLGTCPVRRSLPAAGRFARSFVRRIGSTVCSANNHHGEHHGHNHEGGHQGHGLHGRHYSPDGGLWPSPWLGGQGSTVGEVTMTISAERYHPELNGAQIMVPRNALATITASTPLSDPGLREMLTRYSGVPVVADCHGKADFGCCVGILSADDVKDAADEGLRVEDKMSRPICINAKAHVPYAAGLMLKHNIHRAPVLDDDGDLVGMITRGDVYAPLLAAIEGLGHPEDLHILQSSAFLFTPRHPLHDLGRAQPSRPWPVSPGAGSPDPPLPMPPECLSPSGEPTGFVLGPDGECVMDSDLAHIPDSLRRTASTRLHHDAAALASADRAMRSAAADLARASTPPHELSSLLRAAAHERTIGARRARPAVAPAPAGEDASLESTATDSDDGGDDDDNGGGVEPGDRRRESPGRHRYPGGHVRLRSHAHPRPLDPRSELARAIELGFELPRFRGAGEHPAPGSTRVSESHPGGERGAGTEAMLRRRAQAYQRHHRLHGSQRPPPPLNAFAPSDN